MPVEEKYSDAVAPRGSSLYYSLLYLEPPRRYALLALHSLRRELRDVVRKGTDSGVTQTKLGWWREEIDRIYNGDTRHPLAARLHRAVSDYALPQEYLLEMFDAVTMDFQRSQYPSFTDLSLYCHRSGGVIGSAWAEICGYSDRSTLKFGHQFGMGLALSELLLDLRRDNAAGRCYVPHDELQRFQVQRSELSLPQTSAHVSALLRFQLQRIREFFGGAVERLAPSERLRQSSALIMLQLNRTLLDEVERNGMRLLEHEIQLTPLRKYWLARKIQRAERRRAKTLHR